MKCSDLKISTPVVFKTYSDILERKIPMDGNVIAVIPETRNVVVCWLEGYKSRTDNIPYEDMIAAHDPNGEMMRFENISGKSVLLVAE